jgi:hypothetical protein
MNQQDAQILANNLFYFTVYYMIYMFWMSDSSKTCRASKKQWNKKDYLQEFVHLVGSSTHCNMMHGTFNVKLQQLSFALLYAHHQNKIVSDDTTKEMYQYLVTLTSSVC